MMELCQTTGVIEPDACTPVLDGIRLVVELVVALEDVLQLFLGDALAGVGDGDLDEG